MTSCYQSESVNNEEFLSFYNLFELKELPFSIMNVNQDGKKIDSSLVKIYLEDTIDASQSLMEYYYYECAFKANGVFYVIVNKFWSPGHGGINNIYVMLYSFDSNGNIIDAQEIGCFCNNTNLGMNEYYALNPTFNFNKEGFVAIINSKHATLFPEESESPFENESQDSINYKFKLNGKIIRENVR